MTQRTLRGPCSFSGVGIHSGQKATLTCRPAPPDTGLVFVRRDQQSRQVPVIPSSLVEGNRATLLQANGVSIATPEHLLSACSGLGIHNLFIDIDCEEVPILDGSALSFVSQFIKIGIEEQEVDISPFVIQEPIVLQSETATLVGLPYAHTQFTYHLSYPDHFIGSQTCSFLLGEDDYAQAIAPARTYGFLAEVEALRQQGLAKGGSLDNAVVIGEDDYLTPLRFDNELARHKLLDMIGDLACLGRPIQGHIVGIGSGHGLNKDLVLALS